MRALYLEPFDGGSHSRFTQTIIRELPAHWIVLTLPGRHWKWRMRGFASWVALAHRAALAEPYDLVWASSFVPLAELIGLCPSLASARKVLYFHENQLAYPVRDEHTGERDFHFGFTQMVSALAADVCVFNSEWNRSSFLAEAEKLLGRMPDAVPPGFVAAIERKSRVLGVPLLLPPVEIAPSSGDPVILWNHRWEHDKGPEVFFHALYDLDAPYRLIVCGESFAKQPPVFAEAQARLQSKILHFGHAEPERYRELLLQADLAVSTAEHEFFGLSVLEAVHYGARPVVPDRLSYRELFPAEYRYTDLRATLAELCRAGAHRRDRSELLRPFGAALLEEYRALVTSMRPGG